jgi:2-haloacid dehalogenase
MGVTKDETVHVAMSMVLDMQACKELGIRGIWINRNGEKGNPDWLPYEELPDLSGVPDVLLP